MDAKKKKPIAASCKIFSEQECLEVANFAYSQKTRQQLNHLYFLIMLSFLGKTFRLSFCAPLILRQQAFLEFSFSIGKGGGTK